MTVTIPITSVQATDRDDLRSGSTPPELDFHYTSGNVANRKRVGTLGGTDFNPTVVFHNQRTGAQHANGDAGVEAGVRRLQRAGVDDDGALSGRRFADAQKVSGYMTVPPAPMDRVPVPLFPTVIPSVDSRPLAIVANPLPVAAAPTARPLADTVPPFTDSAPVPASPTLVKPPGVSSVPPSTTTVP